MNEKKHAEIERKVVSNKPTRPVTALRNRTSPKQCWLIPANFGPKGTSDGYLREVGLRYLARGISTVEQGVK